MKSNLITAKDGWGEKFIDFSSFWHGIRVLVSFTFPIEIRIANSPIVRAKINHGRWIADCPFCTGSELVWFEEPSLFFCFSCKNKAVGSYLLKVEIPKSYQKIENILMVRHPVNRNWQGETLSALKSENTKVGVV